MLCWNMGVLPWVAPIDGCFLKGVMQDEDQRNRVKCSNAPPDRKLPLIDANITEIQRSEKVVNDELAGD